jgi:hypothetical protein
LRFQSRLACRAIGFAQERIASQSDNGLRESLGLAWRHYQSGFIGNNCFGVTTDIGDNHWKTRRHRFEDGVGEAFFMRAEKADVARRQQAGNI